MVSLSVVIPVYNRAHLIRRTLDAIVGQELEIIVVDDGSTDLTREILQSYGDRLKVLSQQNQGPGAARNLGITQATGDYLLFLDSDDLWFPWSLSVIKDVIKVHNYPAFVAGRAREFVELSELSEELNSPPVTQTYADYYASSDRPLWFLGGAVAVKRSVLQQVGGYTNCWINGEDSDLWLKLGMASGFVWVESPCLLAYYQHSQSAVRNQAKTYAGAWYMIRQEQSGQYPGGRERQRSRRAILTRHLRPVTLAYLREGQIFAAWQMYLATLVWNLNLKRFIYLSVFWAILIKAILTRPCKSWSVRQQPQLLP